MYNVMYNALYYAMHYVMHNVMLYAMQVRWVDLLEFDGLAPYTYSEELPYDDLLQQHQPGVQERTQEQPRLVIAALPRAVLADEAVAVAALEPHRRVVEQHLAAVRDLVFEALPDLDQAQLVELRSPQAMTRRMPKTQQPRLARHN